jgi:hypothetical protein
VTPLPSDPKREESAGAIKIRFKTTGDRFGG